MDIPDFLLQHEIEIEPYLGVTGSGADSFGAAVDVPCFVDEKVRRVIAPTGEETVSDATAYAVLDTAAPAGSRVTLPSGRVGRVIAALRRDGGDLPVPSHLEIIIGGA
jgi:hypothetical protein